MGQFYKTSKPEYVDFMYKPAWELAKEVVKTQDKKVDDGLLENEKLKELLNFNYLQFDADETNKIKLEYGNKIREISDNIKKDPSNFNKYYDDIRKVSTELQQSITNGKIKSITSSYDDMQNWLKAHKNYKSADMFEGAKAHYLLEGAKNRLENGYDNTGGKSVITTENLMEHMDLTKGFLAHLKAMGVNSHKSSSEGSNGRYIFTNASSKKELTKEQVTKLMKDYLATVNGLDKYKEQSIKFVGKDPTENLIPFAENFAYRQVESRTGMKVDGYGIQQEAHKNRKELMKYKNDLDTMKDFIPDHHITPAEELVGSNAAKNLKEEDKNVIMGAYNIVQKGYASQGEMKNALEKLEQVAENPSVLGSLRGGLQIISTTNYKGDKAGYNVGLPSLNPKYGTSGRITPKQLLSMGFGNPNDDRETQPIARNVFIDPITGELKGMIKIQQDADELGNNQKAFYNIIFPLETNDANKTIVNVARNKK